VFYFGKVSRYRKDFPEHAKIWAIAKSSKGSPTHRLKIISESSARGALLEGVDKFSRYHMITYCGVAWNNYLGGT
jgi:hypothetical protein